MQYETGLAGYAVNAVRSTGRGVGCTNGRTKDIQAYGHNNERSDS